MKKLSLFLAVMFCLFFGASNVVAQEPTNAPLPTTNPSIGGSPNHHPIPDVFETPPNPDLIPKKKLPDTGSLTAGMTALAFGFIALGSTMWYLSSSP